MSPGDLAAAAAAMRARAYAPYSKYTVGAALLAADGRVFTGCNVENASYGLTICAERTAIFTAVAAGVRAFTSIAVATRDGGAPCGACRQVLREFAPDLVVHSVDDRGNRSTWKLPALLPDAFGPESLTP